MKRLLVLGATGGTGRHIVSQALEAGHAVTAYIRDPAKLEVKHERLRVVAGAIADDATGLREAMHGQQGVISALGRYRVGEHLTHRIVATVSRADLAHFLLSQLDDRTYVRRIVQLGY